MRSLAPGLVRSVCPCLREDLPVRAPTVVCELSTAQQHHLVSTAANTSTGGRADPDRLQSGMMRVCVPPLDGPGDWWRQLYRGCRGVATLMSALRLFLTCPGPESTKLSRTTVEVLFHGRRHRIQPVHGADEIVERISPAVSPMRKEGSRRPCSPRSTSFGMWPEALAFEEKQAPSLSRRGSLQ